MTQTTPNLGLTKPGGGSTGLNTPPDRVDIDVLNGNFDKIDEAIGDPDEQNRQWYGPAAEVNTIPVDPKDGDTYQESDGQHRNLRRIGGTFYPVEQGLVLLRPASVANGTIQADGSVAFSAVASCSLDGVFSTRFRSYLVEYAIDARTVLGGSGEDRLSLRAAGVDAESNYAWIRATLQGGSITNSSNPADSGWGGSSPQVYGQTDKIFRIERPAQAIETRISMVGSSVDTDASSLALTFGYAGYHSLDVAYDGIRLKASTGNITGKISVFGIV